jgi:hypothetical protein
VQHCLSELHTDDIVMLGYRISIRFGYNIKRRQFSYRVNCFKANFNVPCRNVTHMNGVIKDVHSATPASMLTENIEPSCQP